MLHFEDLTLEIQHNFSFQALCTVAQMLCAEGYGKTWTQCETKLKNLKSQHRMITRKIPNIHDTSLDIESNDILKQLITEYRLTPSSIKHMRFLNQFLDKCAALKASTVEDDVVPIESPEVIIEEPVAKKAKKDASSSIEDFNQLLDGNLEDGHKYLEKFNKDMMDQFMEYQKRYSDGYVKWKQERYRAEQKALEEWHKEAREHEKQMLGVFCSTVAHCNNALNVLMKAKQEAQDELKSLKMLLEQGQQSKVETSDPGPELVLSDD